MCALSDAEFLQQLVHDICASLHSLVFGTHGELHGHDRELTRMENVQICFQLVHVEGIDDRPRFAIETAKLDATGGLVPVEEAFDVLLERQIGVIDEPTPSVLPAMVECRLCTSARIPKHSEEFELVGLISIPVADARGYFKA